MGILDDLGALNKMGALEPARPSLQVNPLAAANGLSGILGGGSLFHGSQQAGLKELIPGQRGPFGPAVYASPMDSVARRYGGNVYQLNPQGEIFHGLGSTYLPPGTNPYEVWRSQTAKLAAAASPEQKQAIMENSEKFLPSDGYSFFNYIARSLGSKEAAQDLFRKAGFAGVSGHVDGPEIAIFNKVTVDQ